MRRVLWSLTKLFILLGFFVLSYVYLVLDATVPVDARFALDVTELRRLAAQPAGERPQSIQLEHVGSFVFAQAMIVPGDPWKGTPVPVYAYQLSYPNGRSIIIDAAMDDSLPAPDFLFPAYFPDAYRRLQEALLRASAIVVTHEHFDHIAGVTDHPQIEQLLPALKLTAEQVDNADRSFPASQPDILREAYTPLRYSRLHALAPGVVLIKSPGHTPGSQMVYVRMADNRELLFVGDVAWKQRNIETRRERPRFMTLLLREDRQAVFGLLNTLHELQAQHPEIRQLPGHDATVIQPLLDEGWLQAGMR